ncbi:hypothetical protein [Actinosynnema sp. NPDC020468]|uniref:hypothetical protein n=1 Tax=Actinosynnema sp. NPDC020468 TaxID=3154488 RepID=UPI00340623CB
MSEAELREGLRAAVECEPPLEFDPDRLIAQAEHARRQRTALVSVGVLTVAIIGTVLVLPGLSRPAHQVEAANLVTSTTFAPARPTLFPSTLAPAPGAVAAKLTEFLEGRFPQVVPAARGVRVVFQDARSGVPGALVGSVVFADDRGTTGLTVQVDGPASRVDRAAFCQGAKCLPDEPRADGSVLSFATQGPAEGMRSFAVAHFRADGGVVRLTEYNYDPAKGGDVRPSLPLSTDELVLLATDPELPTG